jgi:hypothetical protein
MNRVATPAAPRSTSCARARVLAAIVAAALIPPGCSTGGALSAPVDDVGEGQGTAPDALGAEAGAHAPTAPAPALSWRVSDRDTGETIPAKVVLVGVAGTADPGLSPSMLVLADSDDGYAAHNRIFSLSGIGGINPPAGTYEVWVSRGIEWSHHVERVVIGGPPVEVDAQLGHVIDTAGWLSADLHVHAEPSHDSVVPLPVRVLQFISEGVEMIVATDHNVITDYQPTIDALDAADLLASASGCEVTTPTFGHFGSYPLVRNPVRPFGGPPAVEGVLPQALFDAIHASSRLATIAVNHPTWGGRDYFNRGGLDAAAGKAAWKDFSWDFDAIEVLNGFHDPGRGLLDRNLGDFFALIDHGYIRTATGNSDTHLLRLNIGGYPRNYLLRLPRLPPRPGRGRRRLRRGPRRGRRPAHRRRQVPVLPSPRHREAPARRRPDPGRQPPHRPDERPGRGALARRRPRGGAPLRPAQRPVARAPRRGRPRHAHLRQPRAPAERRLPPLARDHRPRRRRRRRGALHQRVGPRLPPRLPRARRAQARPRRPGHRADGHRDAPGHRRGGGRAAPARPRARHRPVHPPEPGLLGRAHPERRGPHRAHRLATARCRPQARRRRSRHHLRRDP